MRPRGAQRIATFPSTWWICADDRFQQPRLGILDVGGDRARSAEHLIVGVGVALSRNDDRHRGRLIAFAAARALKEIAPDHAARKIAARQPSRSDCLRHAWAALRTARESDTPAKCAREIDFVQVDRRRTRLGTMMSREFRIRISCQPQPNALSWAGMLAGNFTSDSIWNTRWSNRIDRDSLFQAERQVDVCTWRAGGFGIEKPPGPKPVE